MNEQTLLEIADDELVLGWRDSEWTGIAPFLEEDVAFSSIAQGEIGHARALYELTAAELGGDADALAFDREPDRYRCAPLVELRLPEWARTIARHYLYENADSIRIAELKESGVPEVAGLAAKIEREEAYHLIHAEMWIERLKDEQRLQDALDELWPYSLGVLPDSQREEFHRRVSATVGRDFPMDEVIGRDGHTPELRPLWQEMTIVRRSLPGASW